MPIPLIGLACALVGFLAPIYMLLLVFFIRWNKEPTYIDDGPKADDPSFIIRGTLPNVLQWAQTPDSLFPGGMYEPTIRKYLGNGNYLRRLFTSYVWAGWRNRAHGLAHATGMPAIETIPNHRDARQNLINWKIGKFKASYSNGSIWQTWIKLYVINIVYGYEVYTLPNGKYWAVPICTLKR